MANKLIRELGLPHPIANVFAARNIATAKDALSLPELELMSLLDIPLSNVRSAVSDISAAVCPPHQTALSLMEERVRGDCHGGRLPTLLKGLDDALGGGIPFGCITELVGQSGIGKTQFCLKLSLLATLPICYGGLNGRVVYIDTESKFCSRRIIEIGVRSFPQIFGSEKMAQEMAGRIIVLRTSSLSEFSESLQQIKLSLLQNEIKLLIVDSMASLILGESESKGGSTQRSLRQQLSFLMALAEFSRIPVLVTNQVRSCNRDELLCYPFEGTYGGDVKNFARLDSCLTAALGIQWAHAVTVRLIFEVFSGHRVIKVSKSPMSPPLAFPFVVESSGISLLTDDGIKVTGLDIGAIRNQDGSIYERPFL